MRIALGILSVLFGSVIWFGQIISSINYEFATKVGLQEPMSETDPLFQRAELNTARWDCVAMWTILAAGILMLFNNSWWPYLALIAGGVYIDTGGREIAKVASLKAEGVRAGSAKDSILRWIVFSLMILGGLCLIVAAIYVRAR